MYLPIAELQFVNLQEAGEGLFRPLRISLPVPVLVVQSQGERLMIMTEGEHAFKYGAIANVSGVIPGALTPMSAIRLELDPATMFDPQVEEAPRGTLRVGPDGMQMRSFPLGGSPWEEGGWITIDAEAAPTRPIGFKSWQLTTGLQLEKQVLLSYAPPPEGDVAMPQLEGMQEL